MSQLIERVVSPIVFGILSSLAANWIGSRWLELDKVPRLLLAAAIGLATAATIVLSLRARKSGQVRGTRVVDGIRSRGPVRIKDVEATLDDAGDTSVVTDVRSRSGDVDISGIRVGKPAK